MVQPHIAMPDAQPPAIQRKNAWLLGVIALFSAFVNALMLTGPIFMLQVYDRVLGSRSEETLVALAILVTFLFLMMGLLDYARGRVASAFGARLQDGLAPSVFTASLALSRRTGAAQNGLHDLTAVHRLTAAPVFLAMFDIPWTPLFLAAIFLLHPGLGVLAVAGGGVLMGLAALNQVLSRAPLAAAAQDSHQADRMADDLQADAEVVQSLGMQANAFRRWAHKHDQALHASVLGADRVGGISAATRATRLFLQSAILGLGAYFVLQGELTAGGMIAASILLGRALAPIEQVLGQWPLIAEGHGAWRRVQSLLRAHPTPKPHMTLPRPTARLEVNHLTVVPPGTRLATLRGVSFEVSPGQAVGVIGPSGSGKSTLARAITSVWPPAAGAIRLDGATLDQYDSDDLGGYIGYLPQSVTLFDGTIAENIARLSQNPDGKRVVAAAMQAAAHQMILDLPQGYDTKVSHVGSALSGGQIQRIGLARALYPDPVLLVLDEPNSALDNEGSAALNTAIHDIKADGRAVLIMAHRPSAIKECDKLLVLNQGQPSLFGPTKEVLQKTLTNYADLRAAARAPGGMS